MAGCRSAPGVQPLKFGKPKNAPEKGEYLSERVNNIDRLIQNATQLHPNCIHQGGAMARSNIRLAREIPAILGRLKLDELELETLKGFITDLAKTYPTGARTLTTADRQTLKALARCLQAAAGFDADLSAATSARDRVTLSEARQKADNSAKRHMESLHALIAARKPPARAQKEQAKSLTGFNAEGMV